MKAICGLPLKFDSSSKWNLFLDATRLSTRNPCNQYPSENVQKNCNPLPQYDVGEERNLFSHGRCFISSQIRSQILISYEKEDNEREESKDRKEFSQRICIMNLKKSNVSGGGRNSSNSRKERIR
ncbi:hypothetical protein AVEN_29235-1 [Araneus ventricosus]|uniref:Uncharacterized protein n=1 Tax=Araneus ventricosus TaxID=182803 RepID=A0A4Y2E1Q0_ARAVE|nr:hypothetical protein AVEN_29235-1 [Araneus ventricosus]